MSDPASLFDLRAELARIDRDRAETQKLFAESAKFASEQRKLIAAAEKYNRERWTPLLLALAGAFGAAAGFLSILGKVMGWL